MAAKDTLLVSKISGSPTGCRRKKNRQPDQPRYSSARAADGIKAHKKFVNLMAEQIDNPDLFSEFSLETSFTTEICGLQYRLEISGRCDSLVPGPGWSMPN